VSGDWIAGSVRAHALAAGARQDLAPAVLASRGLGAAIAMLSATRWVRDIDAQTPLVAIERRVESSLLWQLRVLAGWLPSEGVEMVRSCAAWFEIRNVEDRLVYLAGGPPETPFDLGRLGSISRPLQSTGSAADIRRLLSSSAWGDPGAEDAYRVRIWMEHRWHRRVRDAAPDLRVWGDAAAWLLAVRERLARRDGAELLASRIPMLPVRWQWVTATQWTEADLWSGEERWWEQLRQEGALLLHSPVASSRPVVGALATLAVAAHELESALEVASSTPTEEGLDATS
jgi:hypothetical protein